MIQTKFKILEKNLKCVKIIDFCFVKSYVMGTIMSNLWKLINYLRMDKYMLLSIWNIEESILEQIGENDTFFFSMEFEDSVY